MTLLGERELTALAPKQRVLATLSVLAAVVSVLMFGTDMMAANTYISENALLVGQAR